MWLLDANMDVHLLEVLAIPGIMDNGTDNLRPRIGCPLALQSTLNETVGWDQASHLLPFAICAPAPLHCQTK